MLLANSRGVEQGRRVGGGDRRDTPGKVCRAALPLNAFESPEATALSVPKGRRFVATSGAMPASGERNWWNARRAAASFERLEVAGGDWSLVHLAPPPGCRRLSPQLDRSSETRAMVSRLIAVSHRSGPDNRPDVSRANIRRLEEGRGRERTNQDGTHLAAT